MGRKKQTFSCYKRKKRTSSYLGLYLWVFHEILPKKQTNKGSDKTQNRKRNQHIWTRGHFQHHNISMKKVYSRLISKTIMVSGDLSLIPDTARDAQTLEILFRFAFWEFLLWSLRALFSVAMEKSNVRLYVVLAWPNFWGVINNIKNSYLTCTMPYYVVWRCECRCLRNATEPCFGIKGKSEAVLCRIKTPNNKTNDLTLCKYLSQVYKSG